MRRFAITLLLPFALITAALCLVAPAANAGRRFVAHAAAAAGGDSGAISNETTITYWAHPVTTGPIRTAPRPSAGIVTTLHYLTEDGYPEVYPVLDQRVDRHLTWFRIRIPGRPNGRTGWVPETSLGPLHVVHTEIVVNEHTLTLTLYRWNKKIFSTRVAVGKASTPTPTGHFWVREKFRAQGGEYGPFALGTADYSVLSDWPRGGIIGIHGTDEPQLVPGYVSHGCVRLRNAAVTKLYPLVPIGTPIDVMGTPRD